MPEMSSEERHSQANAIWLCSNCHTLVDSDEARFPADLLREWKEEAEARAREELGRPLPERADALHQVVAVLTGNAPRFMPDALGNAHRAMELALERLDPRFRVASGFAQGKTNFTLTPTEDVRFKVRVGAVSAKAWVRGVREVFEHGRTAVLPMQGVSIDGSDLLKAIAQEGQHGSLTIAPIGRQAALRLSSPGENRSPAFLERLEGSITQGKSTLRFAGIGLGGLVSVELMAPLEGGEIGALSVTLSVAFEVWQKLDVRTAPYLDRLLSLLENLVHARSHIDLALEVEGNEVFRRARLGDEPAPAFEAYLTFAMYVARARTVARALGLRILIDANVRFTREQHEALAEAAELFEMAKRFSDTDLQRSPSFRLTPDPGAIALIEQGVASGQFFSVLLVPRPQILTIFNEQVEMPSRKFVLDQVQFAIRSRRKTKKGIQLDLVTNMKPGSHLLVTYEDVPAPPSSGTLTVTADGVFEANRQQAGKGPELAG